MRTLPKPIDRRGFTLIELLIVVAIIAILAAIAVPNFLCAQTRSKHSRVLSDLRTLRTGIESYAVDWNKPPRMSWGTYIAGLNNTPGDRYNGEPIYQTLGYWLTTPVSYVSRFDYPDPFVKGKDAIRVDYHFYTYQDYHSTAVYAAGASGGVINISSSALGQFDRNLGAYYLMSIGPMATEVKTTELFWTQYDPSNGCVSEGSIFVSQKHTDPVVYDMSGTSILR